MAQPGANGGDRFFPTVGNILLKKTTVEEQVVEGREEGD